MDTFLGLRVITSPYLTESQTIQVRRSWGERLFSLPWRPWQTTRTAVVYVPMRRVIRVNETTVAMHPETFQQLRAMLGVS